MIQQWVDRIPKWLLSIIVVGGALLFMVISEPPESVCNAQMAVVGKKLRAQFTYRKDNGWTYNSKVDAKYKFCLQSNSAGGCLSLLQRFNYFEKQVRTVPSECRGHDSIKGLQRWMVKALVLIPRLAWGEAPPETEVERVGWLDPYAISLHCRMSREYVRLFGKTSFEGVVKKTIMGLPGIETVYDKQRREKTLFGVNCRSYLR